MVQYKFRFTKGIAIELRKKGLSYAEIENSINIPKSTVAYWVRNIKLDDSQLKKLSDRQKNIAKKNLQRRKIKIANSIKEVEAAAVKDVEKISSRELWLMGVILCWREVSNKNQQHGLSFTSSDPYLIKLFLRWLKEVGKINPEEIRPDIFIEKGTTGFLNEVIKYWSKVSGLPTRSFSRFYYLKKKDNLKSKNRIRISKAKHGFLKLRVSESSMLARQVSGWIKGIQAQHLD